MISFKEFLAETAVGAKPKYKQLEVEKAIALLNKHAKNALWMLEDDSPLYRGDVYIAKSTGPLSTGFAIVDTSATKRRSTNTSNFYTAILDNHPKRKQFPKRSRSFICSTDQSYAANYAHQDPNVIIPFDGVPIGAVNREDMWDTRINLFGRKSRIDMFNDLFQDIVQRDDFESFLKADKEMKDPNSNASYEFKQAFGKDQYEKAKSNFLKQILDAYSAEKTGHTFHTTSNLKGVKGEVWVGGKVMVISDNMWRQLLSAYSERKSKK